MKEHHREGWFRQWEADSSGVFTFLGFDYYWGRATNNRNWRVAKRRTNKKKFRHAVLKFKEWIKKARSWLLKMILSSLRNKLRGYWNYYCVQSNGKMVSRYLRTVTWLVFKWLNRRSQRKSYSWKRFLHLWYHEWDIPKPKVVEGYIDFNQQGKGGGDQIDLLGAMVKC